MTSRQLLNNTLGLVPYIIRLILCVRECRCCIDRHICVVDLSPVWSSEKRSNQTHWWEAKAPCVNNFAPYYLASLTRHLAEISALERTFHLTSERQIEQHAAGSSLTPCGYKELKRTSEKDRDEYKREGRRDCLSGRKEAEGERQSERRT